MDRLEIHVQPMPWRVGKTGSGRSVPYGGGARMVLNINGTGLLDLVRASEIPQPSTKGQAPRGGPLSPLWSYRFNRELFFGGPSDAKLQSAQGAVLMGCGCGEVRCWPLMARIEVASEAVTWSSIQWPRRRGWSYKPLGPFVFERGRV